MHEDNPPPEPNTSSNVATLFNDLYVAQNRPIYAFFFGRTGDPDIALDLRQETFLRVWRHCHDLQTQPPDQQRYWLFAVARHVLIDHYRRQATRSMAEQNLISATTPQRAIPATMEDTVADAERLQILDRAIHQLPENLRTALVMQVLGGLSSSEIGQILERPAGTIRYQIAQARQRLAQALQFIDTDRASPDVSREE